MRRAFAAEGLPLEINYREGETVYLSHTSFILPVGDVEVTVRPRGEATGNIYVVIMQGHRVTNTSNVIVDFDPHSASARKARAALALLRRRA